MTYMTHTTYIHNSYFKITFLKLIERYFYNLHIYIYIYIYVKLVNKYYQKHKERLQKEARERYQNLSEEEIDKSWKKARERYQNFTE